MNTKRRLLEPKFTISPVEYPEFEEFKLKIQQTYWVHDEIDFSSDVQDYLVNLNETEKYIIEQVLTNFSQSEIAVGTEYWLNIVMKYFEKPEIQSMAITFCENERRHLHAYHKIVNELKLDHLEVQLLADPIASERLNNLSKFSDLLQKDKFIDARKLAKSIAIFSCFTEYVSLFSQFLILKSFSCNGRNLMKNIANIIDWSAIDEQIHSIASQKLFNFLIEENPEIWDDEFKSTIYTAAQITFDIECSLIDQIFIKGELPNLTIIETKNFLRDRLNRSLKNIGLKPIFNIDEDALEATEWFYENLNLISKVDFFAKRPTEYQKQLVVFSKDTVAISRDEVIKYNKHE
jgi:ribonucleoside-diphosphate reductase beta chain